MSRLICNPIRSQALVLQGFMMEYQNVVVNLKWVFVNKFKIMSMTKEFILFNLCLTGFLGLSVQREAYLDLTGCSCEGQM
ncbi:hypothetical protein L1987_36243 [Smallanthus sonchifolius]|uniref:Uncharacterized protein n=1 Tax=Smallanthus sonchifolius TaxID=185202 RepID=A0ACB9HE97_9ASTR|nr:hypothetical protein L1987_36243 [Smallanthus sonchifolius]